VPLLKEAGSYTLRGATNGGRFRQTDKRGELAQLKTHSLDPAQIRTPWFFLLATMRTKLFPSKSVVRYGASTYWKFMALSEVRKLERVGTYVAHIANRYRSGNIQYRNQRFTTGFG